MRTREAIRAVYDQGPEAILALGESLCARIAQQQAQSAEVRARVTDLEDRLVTQSRTSSPPPSSDSVTKQTRSLPQGAVPAQTRIHAPEQCVACGASLAEGGGQFDPERRQVFALPPLQWEVTAHRVMRKACAVCGHHHRGTLPAGVACGARDGAGVTSVLPSRNQAHLLPSARSGAMVTDLCGQPISAGRLEAAVTGCPTALAETETSLIPSDFVVGAKPVHARG